MLSLILTAALSVPVAGPTSTPVALPSDPSPIHGTLLAPEGQARAVAVILPGSGPTDRDGNSPLGVSASTYRLLAEGLAEQGIATVRIDKRGIAASAAAGLSETDLRFDHYVADARAWAEEAAARTGKPCAWLIGHSEGALIALAATKEDDDKICGLVLLSGAGRRARVVLEEQLAPIPEPLKTQAYAALAELETGRTVADTPPALQALFRPSVQPYLISWFAYDPAVLIAAYDGPILIGQGTTDLQITVEDARALASARPDATLVLWEGVNHVLKLAPADRAGNAATYRDPSLPLAGGIVDDVAEFILTR
ncbi:alpha/beta hydrolase [Brevundimonas sp. Root1279]|uniref:alpha/beta hydrolase n=1 Tax=Brevundimonas sp. Root1279 TaxID=1736443 RepID=UPI000701C70D|nr:alpha/beta fold hydrolase [Brevundimonas sp. Root1279]KQW80878.1 alpha/beta hydrolase [Brevundimonas sp. Root1279]